MVKQANTSCHRPSKAVYATGMAGMGAMVISGIARTTSTDRIVARVEKTMWGKGLSTEAQVCSRNLQRVGTILGLGSSVFLT